MRTEAIEVYKFEELDEQAKEKAREWYRSDNDFFGAEFIIEDESIICSGYEFTENGDIY